MPKGIVPPGKLWDLKNIRSYVPPLQRKIKVGPVPRAWIKKK
jgi:hypothetical protein